MNRSHLVHFLVVVAICIAGWLIYRTIGQYSPDEIMTSLREIPAGNILAALGFAAASYFCLTMFDYLGLRYAGAPLAYPKAALASFTSLAIGHNVGVAALSSGAVRYRFYTRWGLGTEQVAKLILFCGVTVGLGLVSLAGLCLIALPESAGKIAGLGNGAARLLGLACLAAIAAYLGLAAFMRGEIRIRTWRFALPSLSIAAAQVGIGTLNFAFVAACLHQLLAGAAGYMETTAAYVVGNLTALVSHVPGGLGVLEATISYLMGGSASIGALVAFRVVYFFIPLPLGLLSLVLSETLLGPDDAPDLANKPN